MHRVILRHQSTMAAMILHSLSAKYNQHYKEALLPDDYIYFLLPITLDGKHRKELYFSLVDLPI